MADFNTKLAEWLKKAQMIVNAEYRGEIRPVLTISPRGRKYIKILRKDQGQDWGSAFCFIDKITGDVLKASSYSTPAKHARGNIYTDNIGVNAYGGYYLR